MDHVPVSAADRRRTVAGLTASSRRLALRLLSEFSGWDSSKLETLRLYCESHARLEALRAAVGEDTARAVQREVRCHLALLKMLNLQG